MAHTALAVAKRILERKPGLTPMQLIKLVYICHGWRLGVRGEPLFNEPVEAWAYGPVIRSVYDAVRTYGSGPIPALADVPAEVFSADESKMIDWVVDYYSQFSGIRLSKMTHMPNTPWDITWREGGKNAKISNDLIQEFYARQAERKSAGSTS